jgi:hypothetical protein
MLTACHGIRMTTGETEHCGCQSRALTQTSAACIPENMNTSDPSQEDKRESNFIYCLDDELATKRLFRHLPLFLKAENFLTGSGAFTNTALFKAGTPSEYLQGSSNRYYRSLQDRRLRARPVEGCISKHSGSEYPRIAGKHASAAMLASSYVLADYLYRKHMLR